MIAVRVPRCIGQNHRPRVTKARPRNGCDEAEIQKCCENTPRAHWLGVIRGSVEIHIHSGTRRAFAYLRENQPIASLETYIAADGSHKE
jgi:hypothetical protein